MIVFFFFFFLSLFIVICYDISLSMIYSVSFYVKGGYLLYRYSALEIPCFLSKVRLNLNILPHSIQVYTIGFPFIGADSSGQAVLTQIGLLIRAARSGSARLPF